MVSGSISKLPQSGHWMVWVKKIFGFILIVMAVYFARHILGPFLTGIGYVAASLVAGLILWPFDRTPQKGTGFTLLKAVIGLAWIAGAAVIALSPAGPFRAADGYEGIEWEPFSQERIDEALAEGKPVMIDFSADWCIPCRELEHKTFSDEAVMEYAEGFVRLKMDLTTINREKKRIKRDFGIRGVPTIIFLDSSGAEVKAARVTGFVGPDKFLERMKESAGKSK
jgi:thiol:disulfide interchange protein DsbD